MYNMYVHSSREERLDYWLWFIHVKNKRYILIDGVKIKHWHLMKILVLFLLPHAHVRALSSRIKECKGNAYISVSNYTKFGMFNYRSCYSLLLRDSNGKISRATENSDEDDASKRICHSATCQTCGWATIQRRVTSIIFLKTRESTLTTTILSCQRHFGTHVWEAKGSTHSSIRR